MPKTFKLGRTTIDTKSLVVGVLVAMVGLSCPPTASIFNKIYDTISGFVKSIFKK